jgi:uncharacterized NAD-dependent epimerase/dehydratase family protein
MLAGPSGRAVALSFGRLHDASAKTAHGLLRGSDRFHVMAIVDSTHGGRTSTQVLGATVRDVPIFGTSAAAIEALGDQIDHAVVGVAFPGGKLPDVFREDIALFLRKGIHVVSGLHQPLGEEPDLRAAARAGGAEIFDIRQPRRWNELHFWSGGVLNIQTPIVAVLGTDCALGKRTTARIIMEGCRDRGLRAEMIYTGQTGWMQGFRYGFILDSTLNDFVSGELEHAILECQAAESPDVILLEGQSSLRNPTGPCGAEFLLSGHARHVVLQAAPGRSFYKGTEALGCALPAIADEIELIERYGATVIAVTLNHEGLDHKQFAERRAALQAELSVPVLDPFQDAQALVDVVAALCKKSQSIAEACHAG